MKTLLLFLLIPSLLLAANKRPEAEVSKKVGEVFFESRKVTPGMILKEGGFVSTGPKSLLKIKIKAWDSTVVIGPNSQMRLNFDRPGAKVKYTFAKGICRWISSNADKRKKGIQVQTKNAAMGIRGTDFFLSYNDEFDETEIVMFHGKVLFQNNSDSKNKVLLDEGYWGGIGGRFGESIQKPIKLSARALEVFARKVVDDD